MTYYMDSPAKSGDRAETLNHTGASRRLTALFLCLLFYGGLCKGALVARRFLSCDGCFGFVQPATNLAEISGGGSQTQHEADTMSNIYDVPLHARLNDAEIASLSAVLQKLLKFHASQFAVHFTNGNEIQASHALSGAQKLLTAIAELMEAEQ